MNDGLSRVLRGGHKLARSAGSSIRKAILRAEYPGLIFKGSVYIGPGCDIRVNRGGKLVLENCHVSRGVTLTVGASALLDISADFIGPNSVLVARESLVVGEGTKIAENVVVRDGNHDHSVPLRSLKFTSSPVRIGSDVWLGAGCAVLSGVSIGSSATVGAGAVVTRAIPAGSVATGVPAVAKPRSPA